MVQTDIYGNKLKPFHIQNLDETRLLNKIKRLDKIPIRNHKVE